MHEKRRGLLYSLFHPKTGIEWGVLLIIVLIIFMLVGLPIGERMSATTVTITVDRRERVNNQDSSYYLVWSSEGETFKCSDAWLFGKFNSSDVYGQLKEGRQYKVLVAGWRIPIFSSYRNIIRIEN
ncbi:MAG: hypothetical protein Q7K33_01720 [Candidatus Berkelbacteria bacterium]|nr:hypothetical protein [Candidatus Berkelbacteria bacterium]